MEKSCEGKEGRDEAGRKGEEGGRERKKWK